MVSFQYTPTRPSLPYGLRDTCSEQEQKAALQNLGKKRRPRAERNKEKPAPEAVMKEKREQLAEARKDLEAAERLRQTTALQEATYTAEIDEETQPVMTANFLPCQVRWIHSKPFS